MYTINVQFIYNTKLLSQYYNTLLSDEGVTSPTLAHKDIWVALLVYGRFSN